MQSTPIRVACHWGLPGGSPGRPMPGDASRQTGRRPPGLRFPPETACVITTKLYEGRAAFRCGSRGWGLGLERGRAGSGGALGILPGVLGAPRAAKVQVDLRAVRLLYVLLGLLLSRGPGGQQCTWRIETAACGRLAALARIFRHRRIQAEGGWQRVTEDTEQGCGRRGRAGAGGEDHSR